jgi:hypothetical protein
MVTTAHSSRLVDGTHLLVTTNTTPTNKWRFFSAE